MSALFNNIPLFHDPNFVGVLYCRKPVGNNHGRSLLHQYAQRFLNRAFRLRIKSRCRLVQQQYGSILQKSPGHCNALSLPTGQKASALSDIRLVAALKLHNEGMRLSGFGGFDNLVHRRYFPTVADIFGDRAAKQI
ncbi:hypothetical protein D3C76_1433620 [compost metagenome]